MFKNNFKLSYSNTFGITQPYNSPTSLKVQTLRYNDDSEPNTHTHMHEMRKDCQMMQILRGICANVALRISRVLCKNQIPSVNPPGMI